MTAEWDRHAGICRVLELLGSEEQQLEYERRVPWVDITTELACVWFDDTYRADDPQYPVQFTRAELEALAAFHEFYDRRVDGLPPSQGTVRTWLASPTWREIMQKAAETLAVLRNRAASSPG